MTSDIAPIALERTSSEHLGSAWPKGMEDIYQRHCSFIEDEIAPLRYAGDRPAKPRPRIRRLPMVAGQSGVRTHSGMSPAEAAIFTDVDHEGAWLFLHPAPPATAATKVVFERFKFDGENRFQTNAVVGNVASKPVRFGLELRSSGAHGMTLRRHLVLNGGESAAWIEDLPPLHGPYDVALSTEMAGPVDRNDFAWAKLLDPLFVAVAAADTISTEPLKCKQVTEPCPRQDRMLFGIKRRAPAGGTWLPAMHFFFKR